MSYQNKELEIAQQLLEAQTRDFENAQQLAHLENKIWLLQRHTKQLELKNTLTRLKDCQQYLQVVKQRDMLDIEMQVGKSQQKVDDYIQEQVDEYEYMLREKKRLMRNIDSHKE